MHYGLSASYNIPDVDLLDAIYSRTTACMDPEDARCAIITFLTGVMKGGASSPRIFTIFVNALLEHLTGTGKALGISHGIEETEQFNNVTFMDDVTTFSQDNEAAQSLLNAVQEFEHWSNMRLNIGKTVVVDIDGGSGELDPPQLTYKIKPVKGFQANESCRHAHHPLEAKTAKERFQSMAVSVFRFSAAQVRWSQTELDKLQSLWVQAYKRAHHLAAGTATDIFVFPKNGEARNFPPPSTSSRKSCATI